MSQDPHTPGARPIRFFHRGEVREVRGLPATLSVLAWLREQARSTGTKEGCNEGDCGACTVLVGELQDDPRQPGAPEMRFKPVNSCIAFVATLDGKALLTVEDLAEPPAPGQPPDTGPSRLHPAQQALVDCHGSQCGFCTPGFAISLAACYERHADEGTTPTRQQLADDLSGNLCRCTGYRPILDAGQRMFNLPPRRLASAAMADALRSLRRDPPLRYDDTAPLHAPRTIGELAALRSARPDARLLAGGTDIGLWVNKQFRELGEIIYLGQVAELKAITEADGRLRIGAGASLEAAWAALSRHWPTVHEMGLRFASVPIREAGTMGGNIANGSPIGDSAPVLIALGAEVVLRRADAQRTLPLDDFYTGYQKSRLESGEFVEALQLPMPRGGELLRAYKLSKRFDSDISALACGLWIKLDGETVAEVRLAFGGMAATVRRAPRAEAALRGKPFTEAAVQAAIAALASDYQPLDDLRASAGYRSRAAGALLRRFWLETRPHQPLAAAQLSVWSRA